MHILIKCFKIAKTFHMFFSSSSHISVESFKTGHNLSHSLHFIAYATPNLLILHSLPMIMYYVGQGSVYTLEAKRLQAESDNLSSSIGRFELHLTHIKRLCGVVNGDEEISLVFLQLSQLSLDIISNCWGIWLLKHAASNTGGLKF